MIKDFVRDHQAYLRCTECNAETTIIKYIMSDTYNFPIIDMSKTLEAIELFKSQHLLCKTTQAIQLNIEI